MPVTRLVLNETYPLLKRCSKVLRLTPDRDVLFPFNDRHRREEKQDISVFRHHTRTVCVVLVVMWWREAMKDKVPVF